MLALAGIDLAEALVANLSIHRLDDKTYGRLRDRATRKGLSIEEEARQILVQAVSTPERLGDLFLKVFGPTGGADLEIPPRESHEPLDLASELRQVHSHFSGPGSAGQVLW